MRRIKLLWVVLALALVAMLAFAVMPAGAAGPTAHLQIENFAFHPYPLIVSPGELVRVKNWDGVRHGEPHTVTANDGSFDTGVVWDTARFRAPSVRGVYQFHCEIHPFMHGVLRVQGGG